MLLPSSLPSEVLQFLPTDANEQLHLAHRITLHAYNQKVSSLEAEITELRELLGQKSSLVNSLEARLGACQSDLYKAEERVKEQVEVHRRLSLENAELGTTVRKLQRSLSRVEAFKKNLLHTLQADEGKPLDEGLEDRFSFSLGDTSYERHRASTHHASFEKPTIPREAQHRIEMYNDRDEKEDLRASALRSVDEPHPVQLEGKELFRIARTRLTAASFADFLANIKLLNNGQQNRDQTLQAAKAIFGPSNQDLYGSFEKLLMRHTSTVKA
eukprot:jgi/Botrbrau1/18718/Bobra.0386s0042.2